MGRRKADLITFEKTRKMACSGGPYVMHCKLGCTVYGRDPYLQSKSVTRCNAVNITDDLLEKKLDLVLHESFAERPHDFNYAHSIEDKFVLQKYINNRSKSW